MLSAGSRFSIFRYERSRVFQSFDLVTIASIAWRRLQVRRVVVEHRVEAVDRLVVGLQLVAEQRTAAV